MLQVFVGGRQIGVDDRATALAVVIIPKRVIGARRKSFCGHADGVGFAATLAGQSAITLAGFIVAEQVKPVRMCAQISADDSHFKDQ
jgi:hypothetical protein